MIRIAVFAVSLAAAGLAAWFAFAVQPNPAAPVVVETPPAATREVLVATAALPAGRTLAATDFEWLEWPEQQVRPQYATRDARPDAVQELVGAMVRSEILAGEPVREDKLITGGAGFLSTLIPADKRAVAVRISAATSAGGFIQPNDRVDVIHTTVEETAEARAPERRSVTLLTNIRVLAIGEAVEAAPSNTVFGATATLELTSEQAEILIAAESSGMISLALRSFADLSRDQQLFREAGSIRVIRRGRPQVVELK